jgi:hypothetical protein
MVSLKYLLFGVTAFIALAKTTPVGSSNTTIIEGIHSFDVGNATKLLETIQGMKLKAIEDLQVVVSSLDQMIANLNGKPIDLYDGTNTILDDILWPVGFNSICRSLSNISADLGHILDRYTGPGGAVCTNEQRIKIDTPSGCSNADKTTNLVNHIIWPLAFQGLAETSDKIAAQTTCLLTILTTPPK